MYDRGIGFSPELKFRLFRVGAIFAIAPALSRDIDACRSHQPSATEPQGGDMPAYWVARSRIIDPVEYKKYTDRVPAIVAKYRGKVLARGGRYQIMEGPDKFHRFIVIEFPTLEDGVACFQSPEYDEAAAFRRAGAGEVETIVVEGGDATPM
jgi:uncharacterized protein (DUF1330 family)